MDARDRFIDLAGFVVKEPISTHLVKTRTNNGKIRYLVIDRAVLPQEGSLIVINTVGGLRVGRLKGKVPLDVFWGTVIWFLEQG
jgi:hypothetical protein